MKPVGKSAGFICIYRTMGVKHSWEDRGPSSAREIGMRIYQCTRCEYELECCGWELESLGDHVVATCDEVILGDVHDS